MFSDHKSTNRTLALFTFVASLILYMLTMAPTASFWDAGEFIAVGHGLQVNHPPGAPLYSLLGRIFSMFMPTSYVAVSINFISALSSALTVMLLYLISVRLVREWKGAPEQMVSFDKIGMYGGSLIGAFSFAVTDTFWFNAVEAEVYAISLFFTAMVVWLALVWAENHDKPHNERWLILISYLFGLALGLHLLNLLALFFVALIIYFKKKEFTWTSFAGMAGLAVVSFLLIYPFTLQSIPSIMEQVTKASYGLIGPLSFIIMVIIAIASGLYYTHKNNNRTANIIILCYTMILIGYSSYALIFIRSAADPPIDENDPETVESFIDYLERKQYGNTPLLTGYTFDNSQGGINRQEEVFFPRRYSGNPRHVRQYSKYSSDFEFFLDYQVKHMYWRYFAWNFIGRDADMQDAGWQSGLSETEHENNPAHNSYFYIPFLLGIFGMLFHFQNDWKRALSVFALFAFTGLAIIVFLNQTPLQPRERDYAYVGSFFAFAIWIGMGSIGLVELIKDYLGKSKAAAYGLLGILFCASPLLMGVQNFQDHDRSERYVAPDYAYNLLQSTAPNSIIFTNGDNDTFPLWYLQEVEGIRTDVRIVCLSLLNTDWYIKQLKNQWSHESPPLPISMSEEEIEKATQSYDLYNPDTLSIPVGKEMLKNAFSSDRAYKKALNVNPDTSLNIYKEGIGFGMPVDSLDDSMDWYYQGRPAGKGRDGKKRYYTQVQDDVILNILRTNDWLRPIYFANTVSTQSQLNLQPYFRFEGKAFRVVPKRHKAERFGWLDPQIHAKRLNKFRFREWNNPDAYFDENIRRMLTNYRFSITELASKYKEMGKADSARHWLQWGEERLPFNRQTMSANPIVLYAFSYADVGDTTNALRLANSVKQRVLDNLRSDMNDYQDIQSQISEIDQRSKTARKNANMNKQQQLRNQLKDIASQRQNIARNVSRNISHLTIIQRIMFMAGNNDQAMELKKQVDDITGQLISIPGSKEENKAQIDQLGDIL
ncbi:Protein of unknown function (DUF2723) [Fodinibius salinus]|uniref:DUF2723 domain-containing protein n=1 Tax=Fodinibius salinus TaxID=860790 RepID=A0A5D3YMR4_9BACT|nr:DUF2723 domain-containing protein [Fodinibius salinus]TYP95164.1 Protein of unknown function (DUF2723) [Fodinibius salinus]